MPNIPVTWRNQFQVNATTADDQLDPKIIQLANGNILVSWTSTNNTGVGSPTGRDVIGQIFDPLGNPVGAEFRLNIGFNVDDEQAGEIVATANGGFIVVYMDIDAAGSQSVRLGEFDSAGAALASNQTVLGDTAGDPGFGNPVVAASSATSVLIVYERTTAGVSTVVGKIYNPSTDTYSAEISLLAFPGGDTTPAVTVLSNGNYVVVARNTANDTSIAYRIVDAAGVNVLGATQVTGTSTDTFNDREPTVTTLAGGGFVIAWTNTDTNDIDVVFRVYNAAGAQIGSNQVSGVGSTDNNNEPVVVGLADGTFVIIYDNDAAPNRLEVERFSATGAFLGNFVITAEAATTPSAVSLADGRFAVVWQSLVNNEIQMEILDTRDAVNSPGVYTPDQRQIGTIGADVFTAANNVEIVNGWDGNDIITAVDINGVQQYFGGEGNDVIFAVGVINDEAWNGENGNDTIDWSSVNQSGIVFNLAAGTATLGASTETMLNFENLAGTLLADTIIGTSGDNTLSGNEGNDVLVGGLGNDTLNGGGGNDTIVYSGSSAVNVALYLGSTNTFGAGVDVFNSIENVVGTSFDDYLLGSTVGNILLGDAGNDRLEGREGNDPLDGQDGNDLLYGGADNDTLNGGAGNDTISYSDATNAVNVALYLGSTATFGAGLDTFISIENVQGTNFADYILGDAGANSLQGLGNNDRLEGREGNDVLDGGAGDDLMFGGAGNDLLAGGDGNDTISYADAGSAVNVALFLGGTNTFGAGSDAFTSVENVVGSAFGDHLLGDAAANRLQGFDGNDQLEGLQAADLLEGNEGNDVLIGGEGADLLLGGNGADRFLYTGAADSISAARDQIFDFNVAVDLIDVSQIDSNPFAGGDQGFTFVSAFTGAFGQATLTFDGVTGNTTFALDIDGNGAGDFFVIINGNVNGAAGFVL